jgi:hypothetical protein
MAVMRATAATMGSALLALALVTPVLGGVQCSLQATVGGGSATEVETGEEVLIEGSGFPPDADIEIEYSVDGTPLRTEMVTADATGFFETTVIPQPGEEGLWTVVASQIKGCSAETGFLVVAGPTPTPSPSPIPSPTPAGVLPNAATSEPGGSSAPILGVLFILAAAVWLSRHALARRMR